MHTLLQTPNRMTNDVGNAVTFYSDFPSCPVSVKHLRYCMRRIWINHDKNHAERITRQVHIHGVHFINSKLAWLSQTQNNSSEYTSSNQRTLPQRISDIYLIRSNCAATKDWTHTHAEPCCYSENNLATSVNPHTPPRLPPRPLPTFHSHTRIYYSPCTVRCRRCRRRCATCHMTRKRANVWLAECCAQSVR